MREYIAKLDEIGELRTVRGATWEEEIGGITELMTERQGPALLFDEVPGYPGGYRVGSNLFTTVRRTALALGLGLDLPGEVVTERWAEKTRGVKPIPHRTVATAPVLENVLEGDGVNLFRDRKSTRLNSSHIQKSRMPSSA